MNYILLAAAIAAADQSTKRWVEKKIRLGQEIELIKDKLSLYHMRNSGAAMGLLDKKPQLLAALTACSSLNILYHFYRIHKDGRLDGVYKFSLACIAGGAFGNIHDRVRHGYVTDFLRVKPHKPVFNISDVFVMLGALVFMVKQLLHSE